MTTNQTAIKPNLCGFGYTVYVNGNAICIAHTLEQAQKMAVLPRRFRGNGSPESTERELARRGL